MKKSAMYLFHYRMYNVHYIPTVYKCMYNAVFYPGMTGTNEYAFIIIPTNYFPLYDWKADPTKSELYWDIKQRDRDEDAKKAFQVKNIWGEIIYIRTATIISLFFCLKRLCLSSGQMSERHISAF